MRYTTAAGRMQQGKKGKRGIRTLEEALKEVKPQVTKIYVLEDSHTILQAFKAG
jgi:hypothetical protein